MIRNGNRQGIATHYSEITISKTTNKNVFIPTVNLVVFSLSLTFCSWLCGLRSSPNQRTNFLSIEISQNTCVSDFEYDLLGFGSADSHYVFNGMPTSSHKFYLRVLRNSHKLERVFFSLNAQMRELVVRCRFYPRPVTSYFRLAQLL